MQHNQRLQDASDDAASSNHEIIMEEEKEDPQQQQQQQAPPQGLLGSSILRYDNQFERLRLQQQQQQQTRAQQPPVRVWPPVRSDPIMIGGTDPHNNNNNNNNNNNSTTNLNNNISNNNNEGRMELDEDSSSSSEERRDTQQLQQQQHTTSSDSDNNNNNNNNNNIANSLPSRLLRAPLLGSLPSNFAVGRDIPDAALPPPMSMEAPSSLEQGGSRPGKEYYYHNKGSTQRTAAASMTSYGSLRDSHSKGRFMDGPSSYRDPRTGDIHRIQQHRVRFQNDGTERSGMAMSFSGSGLDIGERMMQHSKRNNNVSKNPTNATSDVMKGESSSNTTTGQESSTLSKLMESCSHNDDTATTETTNIHNILPIARPNTTSTFYDDDDNDGDDDGLSALPSHILSTSLTGLEILQRGINASNNSNNNNTSTNGSNRFRSQEDLFDQEELPRDANGNNLLLSRSLSDPNPRWRERVAISDPRHSPLLNPNNVVHNNAPTSLTAGGRPLGFLLPPANANAPAFRNPNSTLSDELNHNPSFPTAGTGAAPTAPHQPQGSLAMALGAYPPPTKQPPQQPPATEDNPDTQAAFPLDFEL